MTTEKGGKKKITQRKTKKIEKTGIYNGKLLIYATFLLGQMSKIASILLSCFSTITNPIWNLKPPTPNTHTHKNGDTIRYKVTNKEKIMTCNSAAN